ncbi:Hypothetical protein CB129slpB_0664 [Propionibacterium freudenreichii]|nr:Hypothetical protein CB129slpB_0664 [Propionibacterium freudenreichii]
MQPTRRHRAGRPQTPARARNPRPSWSCSGWGLPCRRSHLRRGGLLHRRFTLTRLLGRFVFCGTVPRVTPGGCCPPPCPVESGLSSTPKRRDHLAGSSSRPLYRRRWFPRTSSRVSRRASPRVNPRTYRQTALPAPAGIRPPTGRCAPGCVRTHRSAAPRRPPRRRCGAARPNRSPGRSHHSAWRAARRHRCCRCARPRGCRASPGLRAAHR